eukprot:scaffold20252_cov18-Phaeocystis_antarctica.AAC.1
MDLDGKVSESNENLKREFWCDGGVEASSTLADAFQHLKCETSPENIASIQAQVGSATMSGLLTNAQGTPTTRACRTTGKLHQDITLMSVKTWQDSPTGEGTIPNAVIHYVCLRQSPPATGAK